MVNNPIPTDLPSESRKAARILQAFIDPATAKGVDNVIPPNILANCKGLAILTVIKAGFVWSGRAGSGLVVARLADGTWSAPSCIGTASVGFGGQIGAEMTDFVIVLNSTSAVKAFSLGGNVTLGGNLSVAAGPYGRNAEGNIAVGHVAPIYSYSKTSGLFVGVSIEGSAIIERKDANAKFYGRKVSAKELLSGTVPPPREADSLYRALNLRADNYRSGSVNRGPPPPVPSRSKGTYAVAMFDFDGEQAGDLPFRKGDLIRVTKQSENQNDWWEGECNQQTGSFPANYVKLN
ncbi:hypothetical protein BJ085DRAFT_43146 [Dimargaris cristalligena]|uniref:SH3 domain-containing protein n=1 Tax=Dimargaris cristalligena TaxID=215637 RepID=A0A4V1J481_9FUNG|nr:hypothetical protein BJ085DRAFT_43146 [Dimargaris cristalligena]|eukprot:RKP34639.1 hypothetical protein BJ085DRAFT_43146 [Dimargaris cristalligena]